MSLQKLPWFAFYPTDFLSSTLEMSPATVGAYIRLLSHQWIAGSIPDEQPSRVRICGGSDGVDWEQIQRRLVQVDGGWAHPRLLAEKDRSNSIAEKRRAHIAKVNDRRSNRDSDCDNDCPTTTTTTTTTPSPVGDGWKVVSKSSREKLMQREKLDTDGLDALLEGQWNYLSKKLSFAGCADSMVGTAWLHAVKVWAGRGVRPSTTAQKLTENLNGCRDAQSVIRYRMKQTAQNAR